MKNKKLMFLVLTSVLNIILDLTFVLGLGMGIEGVAYATILAQGLSALLVLYVLMRDDGIYRLQPRRLRIHGATLRKIVLTPHAIVSVC